MEFWLDGESAASDGPPNSLVAGTRASGFIASPFIPQPGANHTTNLEAKGTFTECKTQAKRILGMVRISEAAAAVVV